MKGRVNPSRRSAEAAARAKGAAPEQVWGRAWDVQPAEWERAGASPVTGTVPLPVGVLPAEEWALALGLSGSGDGV
jgi:hypothetical protein